MSDPRATFLEDSYRFEWASEGVEMVLEQFKESSSGLKCELTVTCSRPGSTGVLQSPMLHNLMTNNAQLVKRLDGRVGGVDWDGLLTQANGISVLRYREGDPMIDLADVELTDSPRFLLNPLVSAHGATVWAADGGTGKSLIAAAAGLSVATNMPILGMYPQTVGSIIYVDWEADEVTHAERLQALWAGAGEQGPVPRGLIHYQKETASLPQIAPRLRRRVNETGAVMVVIDSLGQARGGGVNDDESTNAAFRAARSLGVPCLLIDHVSKAQREGGVKKRTSIGSVYTRNNARLLWVVERDQDEGADSSTVGFVIDKFNFGRLPTRRGFHLNFENTIRAGEEYLDRITITEANQRETSQVTGGNRKWDVAEALKAGPLEAKDIADWTGMSASQVTTLLQAPLNRDFFVRVGDKRPFRWALLGLNSQ